MTGAEAVVTGMGLAVPGLVGPADILTRTRSAEEDPLARLRGKGLRYKDRATKLALCAAREAMTDAGIYDGTTLTVPSETVGVVLSSNYGTVDTMCTTVQTIADESYLGTSPMMLPATASNVSSSWVAIWFKLQGANVTLTNGPTSGLDAVHWARLLISAGRVERVVVVGVEPSNPEVRHVVSGGHDGAEAPQILDGAAAIVLESAHLAGEREVPVLASVGAYARSGSHREAVEAVCAKAPGPIGLYCLPESAGEQAERPSGKLAKAAVHDLSARFGHCSGALGVLQAVAATSWLGNKRTSVALMTAGSDSDDASAALILSARRAG